MVNALKKMVAAIQALSAADFRQVAAKVTERLKQDEGELAVRERANHVERCPHCGATAWGKWGVDRAGLPHPEKKTQGMLHLNNINAYHSRLKAWRGRFRGVARRTLANYLGGHRLLDAARQTLTPQEFLAASGG